MLDERDMRNGLRVLAVLVFAVGLALGLIFGVSLMGLL